MKEFLLRVISVFKQCVKTVMKRLRMYRTGILNANMSDKYGWKVDGKESKMIITIETSKTDQVQELALTLNLKYLGSFKKGNRKVHVLSDGDEEKSNFSAAQQAER